MFESKKVASLFLIAVVWATTKTNKATAQTIEKTIYFSANEGQADLGRYIVVYDDSISATDVENSYLSIFNESPGLVIENRFTNALNAVVVNMQSNEGDVVGDGMYGLEGTSRTSMKRRQDALVLEGLLMDKSVLYIEEISMASAAMVQENPPSWGIDRVDSSEGLDGEYNYDYTGEGVNVYIIDSGINEKHKDFGNRVVGCYDINKSLFGCNDMEGHGTHIAGTVGGTEFGIAKEVNIIAVKVCERCLAFSFDKIIAGVDWVIGQHDGQTAVINISLGAPTARSLNNAMDRALAANLLAVVAAGNSNESACNLSPAASESAFTVAATTSSDRRASYSNYGPCVDIFAPGSDIVSASKANVRNGRSGSEERSGTSFASPHVAGVAALYIEQNPTLDASAIKSRILADATSDLVRNSLDSPDLFLSTRELLSSSSSTAISNAIPPSCMFRLGRLRYPWNCV